jgi:anti-sigma B factor antagonist
MNIQDEMHGEVAVLTLSGTMMGGGETSAFKEHVRRLIKDQSVTQIVVDLGRVKWMNSSAIGILAEGLKTAREDGGDVRLARVGDRIISVFVAMQLEKIFRSYKTVEEAIDSFNMVIREETRSDVAILTLGGTVMGGGETDEFKDARTRLVSDGKPPRIVIDLGDVRWMNSSAIGILASGLKSARESGGDIRLARISQPSISVFSDTQLDKIFESFDDVQAAVSSFDGS